MDDANEDGVTAAATQAWTPYPPAGCVRRAWLTLGGQSIDLENRAGGWFCTSLDLGWPTVRDVVTNRPDDDGVDDRTQFFGPRAVTASITALAGAGARIDDVASRFAPFMVPSARPVLHYVLDRPGAAERTITVRAAGYQWAVEGDNQRDIHLAWVAADPAVYDPTVNTVIAYAGSTGASGRAYNLTFPRTYPTGGGTPSVGRIRSYGDLAVQPLLRIYGPVTTPRVLLQSYDSTGKLQTNWQVSFAAGFQIDATHWVDVDTNRKTAYRDSDPNQPVFASLNFAATIWPSLPVDPAYTDMSISGSGVTSGVSQVQAIWQDAYLT